MHQAEPRGRSGFFCALIAGLALCACAPVPHTDAVTAGDHATLLRVGDAARDAGDAAAAIPFYRRAHQLEPLEPEPLQRLAGTLNDIGAHREAGDAWQRALTLEPGSFEARVGYGETLAMLGHPVLALEQFRLARELGQDAGLFSAVGVAHDILGDAPAAQGAYRQGLALDRNLKLLNNLGLSLALSGALEEAIEVLEEASALPGAGSNHRANLALAHALNGAPERAAAAIAMDGDEASIGRLLAFFSAVAGLPDHKSRVAAMGVVGAVSVDGTVRDALVTP